MPMEALQHPARKPARTPATAVPPRLRPKGPVGSDFFRNHAASSGQPKQSAVERLEADKAKYVKSKVALTKQQPIVSPEVRKPLLTQNTALRPTRKPLVPAKVKQEGVQLNLEHLSNLISDVTDGLQANTVVESEDSEAPGCAAAAPNSPSSTPVRTQVKEKPPPPPPRPDRSTVAKVVVKPPSSANVESSGCVGSLTAGTIRRVDVMPQAAAVRMPGRRPHFIRQPLQPVPLHPQGPHRPAASNLRLFHTRTTMAPPSPLKPVVVPPKPGNTPSPPAGSPSPATPAPNLSVFPPPSPAITRLSSSSSRKRPSLTRSKSDMSDRYSRAGTELERFFNLCGLDPTDLQDLTGSSSDIVSLARFRSVSAPGSECAASDRKEEDDDDDDDDAAKAADRVPYGVSVIERNARVIKWLYGLRQAKENATKTTSL
ncbi:protein FAM110A-like isoform 1-T3 [Pholidichthys leucotaenia]